MNFLIVVLTSLAEIASNTAEVSTIQRIITLLENIINSGIQEIKAIYPAIKNIIAALQENGASTQEQIVQLQNLDAASDAAFEAAAASDGVPSDPLSPSLPPVLASHGAAS